jgi:catechol 2,3-dioxygenase-like lactoylglutathione lyase family enzyme
MAKQQRIPPFRHVGTVFVPVTNQDRALAFYMEILGFEKRFDFEYGGGRRWVEVVPAGSAHRIALVPSSEGTLRSAPHTYCALEVNDAETSHAALKSHGVLVSDIARAGAARTGLFADDVSIEDPAPPQFFLQDPDGNRFLVVQTDG